MAFYNFFAKGRSSRYERLLNSLNIRLLKWLSSDLADAESLGGILLEPGPGQGDMRKELSKRAIPYLGLDINYRICTESIGENNKAINAALPKLPLKDNTVAFIYFSHVIEHLFDYGTVLTFLQESKRVLKPGGKIVVLFPEYESWGNDFFSIDYSHNFPMTSRKMFQLANDSGLSVVKWSDYCGAWLGFPGRVFGIMGKLLPLRILWRLFPIKLNFLRKTLFTFHRNMIFVLENEK